MVNSQGKCHQTHKLSAQLFLICEWPLCESRLSRFSLLGLLFYVVSIRPCLVNPKPFWLFGIYLYVFDAVAIYLTAQIHPDTSGTIWPCPWDANVQTNDDIFVHSLPFRYYLLGNTGVVAYVQNSPEQKLGVFLAVANSCANPFIFFTFMPSFR